MIAPNYLSFDRAGNLYVTDCGDWKADNGSIWCIAPDGSSKVIETASSQFPNGCAVSPDGRYLYVAMSLNTPRVIRIPIADGSRTGDAEIVVELPHTVPDGLAFCADGSLLIACYRPDTIFRLQPDGVLTVLMEDYEGTLLGAPTNVCFGGADLSILFWANLGRWHVGMNRNVGLKGAPLFYPDL
jgi:gluconolactonase